MKIRDLFAPIIIIAIGMFVSIAGIAGMQNKPVMHQNEWRKATPEESTFHDIELYLTKYRLEHIDNMPSRRTYH